MNNQDFPWWKRVIRKLITWYCLVILYALMAICFVFPRAERWTNRKGEKYVQILWLMS